MKKIIATVLAMVMALALCTTAFAAETKVEGYMKKTDGTAVETSKTTLVFTAAKDPTVKDGKTTAKGNVAYYSVSDQPALKYVTVATLADADVVLYNDIKTTTTGTESKTEGTDVIMYLAKMDPCYYVGTVYTSFADACGHFAKPANYSSSDTYYTAEQDGVTRLYVSSDDVYAGSLMVSGKLVNVRLLGDTQVAHVAVPTVTDGKVTGYTCSKCKLAAVKAANVDSIPAGAQVVTGTLYYFPAAGNDAGTKTDGTSSPKTFDAGIAMYVGMALTSVAGSAVVIGKKKEF